MQVSSISNFGTQAKVKRMSKTELRQSQTSNDLSYNNLTARDSWADRTLSRTTSRNTWELNERPSRFINSSIIEEEPYRYIPDYQDEKPFYRKAWFWVFVVVFAIVLVGAIVAIVLGLILPSTNNSASNKLLALKMITVNPETSLECSSTNRGLLAQSNDLTQPGWKSYSYSFSPIRTTTTTVLFGFESNSHHVFSLDATSIVDNSSSSIELLVNPSFELSSSKAVGWMTSCENKCVSQIVSDDRCYNSSGNCFIVTCSSEDATILFLSQDFATTIGHTYTISYMLNQERNTTDDIAAFYLNIY